jgi:tetraacyldisaccharide 4'-kinase
MSGAATGPAASLLRGTLRIAEPFYGAAVRLRNRLFDSEIRKIHRLPRPAISIGNITTGGTGKTPMVRWLAENLRCQGRNVAVLSRGYRSAEGGLGDELMMLDRLLNQEGSEKRVLLRANPNRVDAARDVLREHPEIDIFLLDDGFQHRRIARDLDIVLISASEPFGFGHLLPRGLLREPLSSLKRVGAVVITHADLATSEELSLIEAKIRKYNPSVAVYRAIHAQIGMKESHASPTAPVDHPMVELSRRRFFVFCGIANPQAFDRQLRKFGSPTGSRWFADHHRYSDADLASIRQAAQAASAEVLLTTEKDWVKVGPLAQADGLPIWRVEIQVRFEDQDERLLLDQVREAISWSERRI